MIAGKRVIGVIPARGGSKGLPRKNVIPLRGKPLIAWTIEAAHESSYLDRVILTSDDDEIMEVARQYGCDVPFRRPERLSRDGTPGVAPVLHALEQLPGFDYVVLLQPTSPLRTVEDIDGVIEACVNRGAESAVSVSESDKVPQWMYQLGNDEQLVPLLSQTQDITRRQDASAVYALNGAVYTAGVERLVDTRSFVNEGTIGYVMPRHRSIDIDTELDLLMAEAIASHYDL